MIAELKKLDWEFFQTGPQEGQWLLSLDGKTFVGHQGDALWQRDLEIAWRKANGHG